MSSVGGLYVKKHPSYNLFHIIFPPIGMKNNIWT